MTIAQFDSTTNSNLLKIKPTYEQLEELQKEWQSVGDILIYNDTDNAPLDTVTKVSCQHLKALEDVVIFANNHEAVLTVQLAHFGEYSEYCLVGKANLVFLQEEYSDLPGIKKAIGFHGSETLIIDARLFFLQDEDGDLLADDLVWTLGLLKNNPLLDDDEHYRLMDEACQEAWGDWIEFEFTSMISKEFDIDTDSWNEAQMRSLKDLFYLTADEECIEFSNEISDSIYIDVKQVCSSITKEDIQSIQNHS